MRTVKVIVSKMDGEVIDYCRVELDDDEDRIAIVPVKTGKDEPHNAVETVRVQQP